MFELNRDYGWSKFIVVVPSIAIREGVLKSFEIMAEHFLETYGKKARHFVYNSKQLHNLESFSSDAGINVMIINVQAFNARGEDARRIYLELDDFQSRRPIDVIKKNRPIMILDEPQKMEGKATTEKLAEFDPLMILRYSATHKTEHNKVYRLDAIDAYNQKASDIHIEPMPGKFKTGIRFRIDGTLMPYIEVPAHFRAAMVKAQDSTGRSAADRDFADPGDLRKLLGEEGGRDVVEFSGRQIG
jgi:type II secretory ATPase GspE/PulE/Tfp pilus assembly ATPase PilB-like protein